MTKEALKLAIQLRDTASGYWTEQEIPIIEKLIELLAQHDSVQAKPEPEQEPVAWVWVNNKGWLNYGEIPHDLFKSSPLYTHPPQRKPLTDEEIINKCLESGFERNSLGWSFTYGKLDYHLLKLARAIEAAHGIKENKHD